MTLARRVFTAISWNVLAKVLSAVVMLARAIILARLLPVEVFGIYGGALAAIAVTGTLAYMGLGEAFLHRGEHTVEEESAARQHFTLKLIFTALWAGGLLLFARFYLTGADRLALTVLVLADALTQVTDTPRLILLRRVAHRKLALLQVVRAVGTTIVAVILALQGATLWALLSTDIVMLVVTWFLFFVWRPVWWPRLAWSWPSVRYFLSFGFRSAVASAVDRLLVSLDDLWVRTSLGATAMGFYTRAFTFANFPRTMLTSAFSDVVTGTYAELKGDRGRLSRYYFRTNSLLVRLSFGMGGLFVAVGPEFITLVLGEKWMPMLMAFRILVALTLLAPLKLSAGGLFIAVGRPEQLMRINLMQLVALVVGLMVVSVVAPSIEGVATAMTVMTTMGVGAYFLRARAHVGISLLRIFFWPVVGLGLGLSLSVGVTMGSTVVDMLLSGASKAALFILGYAGVIFIAEGRETRKMVSEFAGLLGSDGEDGEAT